MMGAIMVCASYLTFVYHPVSLIVRKVKFRTQIFYISAKYFVFSVIGLVTWFINVLHMVSTSL